MTTFPQYTNKATSNYRVRRLAFIIYWSWKWKHLRHKDFDSVIYRYHKETLFELNRHIDGD